MTESSWAIMHLVTSAFMAGVIWFVQIVHYPLMNRVTEHWREFELAHQNRTTFVVAPIMFAEALATMMLWLGAMSDVARIASGVTMLSVALSTFAVQVPLHAALSKGFDARFHRLLVQTNLVRALIWSSRVGIAIFILTSLSGRES